MSQVISFTNQKGGVGKTTLCREIGIYLASAGRKTLLLDFDPQGNLTKSLLGLGVMKNETSLYNALDGGFVMSAPVFEKPGVMAQAVIPPATPPLSILTSDIRLASLEKTLLGEMDAYSRLSELLAKEYFQQYEYILIDSPPSLGVLSINALAASTHFVIPMKPALYTMQGTNDLMKTVEKVKKNFNSELKLLGVIINEYDSHPVITREIKNEIEIAFKDSLFGSFLSRSIKVEEAISSKMGLVQLPDCKIKQELIMIALEFISRVEDAPLGGEPL